MFWALTRREGTTALGQCQDYCEYGACVSCCVDGKHRRSATRKCRQVPSSRTPSRVRANRNGALELRQLSLRGAEANQQGRNYGPMAAPARQLNNPAVASVYEREKNWQLFKAMFRCPAPWRIYSAGDTLIAWIREYLTMCTFVGI